MSCARCRRMRRTYGPAIALAGALALLALVLAAGVLRQASGARLYADHTTVETDPALRPAPQDPAARPLDLARVRAAADPVAEIIAQRGGAW